MWPNQVLKLPLIFVYHVPMCMHTLNVSMHSPTWFWLFQALLVTLFPCKFEMPVSTLVFYLLLLLFANLMTWNDSNLIFAHGNQIITQLDTIWSPKSDSSNSSTIPYARNIQITFISPSNSQACILDHSSNAHQPPLSTWLQNGLRWMFDHLSNEKR